jgi:hypothetical protein
MYRYLLVQTNGDVMVFYVKGCAEIFKQIKGGGTIKEVYVGTER